MLTVPFMPLHSFSPFIMLPVIEYYAEIIMLCYDEQILISFPEFLVWEDIAI